MSELLNYPQIINQKIDYLPVRQAGIHNNPVEAGMLPSPKQWLHSSACPCSPCSLNLFSGQRPY
jgi:hypothetical protein